MRSALKVLLGLVLLVVLTVGVLLTAALQREPSVAARENIGVDDVARVIQLFKGNDPRHMPAGRVTVATLLDRDLDLLVGHAAQHWLQAAGRVALRRGGGTVELSAHLPANPFGRWANIDIEVVETGGVPALGAVHCGRLLVPTALVEWAALRLAERAGVLDQLKELTAVVLQVRFHPQQLEVSYAWHADSADRVLTSLLPQAEQERLRAYNQLMISLAERDKSARELSLAGLLQPMFELARTRSAAGGDAVAENRAALLVLALYVNGRGVGSLVPMARSWPRARVLPVLLATRVDFPQHFLVSAALAVESTGPMSQAIGVYKEVADSRGGSGFSFTDMAANRAGTRFGQRLKQDPVGLQQAVAAGVRDADLVPQATDLPEMMPEPEFLRRFGGVGAPAYNEMLAEIDRRVAALPLLR